MADLITIEAGNAAPEQVGSGTGTGGSSDLPFDVLSSEVVFVILTFCDPVTLLRFREVSRRCRDLASDELVWKVKCRDILRMHPIRPARSDARWQVECLRRVAAGETLAIDEFVGKDNWRERAVTENLASPMLAGVPFEDSLHLRPHRGHEVDDEPCSYRELCFWATWWRYGTAMMLRTHRLANSPAQGFVISDPKAIAELQEGMTRSFTVEIVMQASRINGHNILCAFTDWESCGFGVFFPGTGAMSAFVNNGYLERHVMNYTFYPYDRWFTLAIVFDGATIALHADAVLIGELEVGEDNKTIAWSEACSRFTVGNGIWNNFSYVCNGSIARVRMFGTAHDPERLALDLAEEDWAVPRPGDLLASFSFPGGSPEDLSGNGRDGGMWAATAIGMVEPNGPYHPALGGDDDDSGYGW